MMTQSGVEADAAMLLLAIRARVRIPMVFWASLVPWAKETMAAEPICPTRNDRFFTTSLERWVMR
jgi:hypothetical protein